MERLLVLSDTHLRPDGLDRLPDEVWRSARAATAILHAGDVVCTELLQALSEWAPVHAVLGNNDVGRLQLPERQSIEFAGVELAMVHDSGARVGREARMSRWFPTASVVVFGHSHDPWAVSSPQGQLLFNPGSATQRRRQPSCSYGWLVLDGGRVVEHEIRRLQPEAPSAAID